jgi:TonB family protein
MRSVFDRTTISLVFVLLLVCLMHLEAAQAPKQQEHNAAEIVENVPQPDRSILQKSVLPQMARQTKATWLPLVPPEAQPPRLARGIVTIQFTLHSDGTISGMKLERSTGIIAMDRAAWNAIVATPYAAFPSEVALQSVRMRMVFVYTGDLSAHIPDSDPR